MNLTKYAANGEWCSAIDRSRTAAAKTNIQTATLHNMIAKCREHAPLNRNEWPLPLVEIGTAALNFPVTVWRHTCRPTFGTAYLCAMDPILDRV